MTTRQEDEVAGHEYVTKHQAMSIAQRSAQAAVHEILQALGVDSSTPSDIIETQKDMAHLRNHREGTEATAEQIKKVAIVIVITGALGALWLGLQSMLHK